MIHKSNWTEEKLRDHIISNIPANRMLHSNVLTCPKISDHDATYISANMAVDKFETRYKYIRTWKTLNSKNTFKTFKCYRYPYSCDDPIDQLDILNKLILNAIKEHAPWLTTKFTRWKNKLQKEKDHWRHAVHSKQALQSWEKFRAIRNKIKKFINEKKASFCKSVSIKKRKWYMESLT